MYSATWSFNILCILKWCACMCSSCVQCPMPQEGIRLPRTGIKTVVSHHVGIRNPTLNLKFRLWNRKSIFIYYYFKRKHWFWCWVVFCCFANLTELESFGKREPGLRKWALLDWSMGNLWSFFLILIDVGGARPYESDVTLGRWSWAVHKCKLSMGNSSLHNFCITSCLQAPALTSVSD